MAWGVKGQRAVVDFSPKPTSSERLVAGVVTRLDDGGVSYTCAIDKRKAEHAFGQDGALFYNVAFTLCESLASHWRTLPDANAWAPPFAGARMADLSRCNGRTATDVQHLMLQRVSAMYTLMQAYQMATTVRETGIVEKVRNAIRRDRNSEHLVKRFSRELHLGDEAQSLKVDFLGQHYACYFLQITHSARGLEANTERAFGKLYELAALQRFIKKPRKSLGLLDDERPDKFELVMVGQRTDAVQRRAIYQVEALADKGQVIARTLASASAAAEHLANFERQAA